LTDFRLFCKAVAESLAGKSKLVLDEEPARRRHLVLPESPWDRMLPALQPGARPVAVPGPAGEMPANDSLSPQPRGPKS
jgi:hypothetical protein